MKILLVSATKLEVSPVLKKLRMVSSEGELSHYRFGKHSVDVLVTGVGMTATAFYLAKTLNRKYALAINAGVAGSFKRSIPLGSVVNVMSDCFADLGAEDGERFLTLKEMGLGNAKSQVPSPKSQIPKLNSLSLLKRVKSITVNTVHGNTASIKKAVKKFNPDVESMEGAAFFFACDEFKTPCVQVRAVSNYVERRNKKNWKLALAVNNLNIFLEHLLGSI
jgi:futalosine hydrolase